MTRGHSDEKVANNTAVQRVIAAVTAEKGGTDTESEAAARQM